MERHRNFICDDTHTEKRDTVSVVFLRNVDDSCQLGTFTLKFRNIVIETFIR